MKTHKKNTISISIGTLIGNMVVVVSNENEASEAICQKITEALASVVKSVQ